MFQKQHIFDTFTNGKIDYLIIQIKLNKSKFFIIASTQDFQSVA